METPKQWNVGDKALWAFKLVTIHAVDDEGGKRAVTAVHDGYGITGGNDFTAELFPADDNGQDLAAMIEGREDIIRAFGGGFNMPDLHQWFVGWWDTLARAATIESFALLRAIFLRECHDLEARLTDMKNATFHGFKILR